MDKNSYLIDLSESDSTDFGRMDFSAQGHEQRVFSAIWGLEGQVNSGGFIQLFDNEEPELVAFAPAALRSIGAINCAEIVSSAVALAPNRDAPEVAGHLERLEEEFYSYPDNLTDLLFSYIAAHPEVFGAAPAGA